MRPRGHRLTPWRSEYLKWRIETYSGRKADTIDAGLLLVFSVEGEGAVDALSRLDAELRNREPAKFLNCARSRFRSLAVLLLSSMLRVSRPAGFRQRTASPANHHSRADSEVLVPTLVQMPSGEIVYGLGPG